MTLAVGDKVAKIVDGKIVEGEAHRIFEVTAIDSTDSSKVTLKVIE